MIIRAEDLRRKDVVNIKDGVKIGCVDDIEIDTCTAEVLSIVIYGRKKCFGLFGREEDIIIKWKDIDVIGEDAILVCLSESMYCPRPKQNTLFRRLFG